MSLEKDKELEQYILDHIDQESDLLRQLDRDAHVNLLRPRMISGHLQGKVLKMLCRLVQPKYILELGTYTAYATLCLAEGAPQDAEIHTIEVNDELEDFILKYLHQTTLSDKIHLHLGDAMEIIPGRQIMQELKSTNCKTFLRTCSRQTKYRKELPHSNKHMPWR